MQISIVVPVLNEADNLRSLLEMLAPLRARGHEVIVVDGGSEDGTLGIATKAADRAIRAPRGRASQQNAGAAIASGEALLFLHADTRLPPDADRLVADALALRAWGRFDVAIDSVHPMLGLVAAMMNLRSRLTGIATGDQAIFMRRDAYASVGGFPAIALMEDIEISARLRRLGPPACLRARVTTSARRWESAGVVRTILLMWRLRLMYFLGADPDQLARRYRSHGT